MPTPTELYQAGRLEEATHAQIAMVKDQPTDHGLRVFLFELSAFAGDWNRAQRQLEALTCNTPEQMAAVENYKNLIAAELHRRKVFEDGILPGFLTSGAGDWVFQRLEAVKDLRAGDPAAARAKIEASDAAAPANSFSLNGRPVSLLRDCDDLLGPILEVMAHGTYYWLPLDQVEAITAIEPKFPRDLIWLPVKLSVKNGPAGDAYLPCLYIQSHQAPSDDLRLGRATDWVQPIPEAPVRGVGTRMFLADDDAIPLTDWRELLAT